MDGCEVAVMTSPTVRFAFLASGGRTYVLTGGCRVTPPWKQSVTSQTVLTGG